MTLEVDPEHALQGRQYIQQVWDAVNPLGKESSMKESLVMKDLESSCRRA